MRGERRERKREREEDKGCQAPNSHLWLRHWVGVDD